MRPHIPTVGRLVLVVLVAVIAVQTAACNYGVFGRKTTAALDRLDTNVITAVGQFRGDAMDYLKASRDTIFKFLQCQTRQEAHDISVGLLEGTIGYLDSAQNRDSLARFIETIITHTGAAARGQLISFRDDLLDPTASAKLQTLLRGVMQELVLRPADNLVDIALGDRTRTRLNQLLLMAIPAALNDRAIDQIGRLRSTLFGYSMKKDVAGIVDTALLVAAHRVDSNLRPALKDIISDNSNKITSSALAIIIGLGILAIIVGLVIYYVQHQKVKLNQRLLTNVTQQIESMRSWDHEHQFDQTGQTGQTVYERLTNNIKNANGNDDVEMYRFLKQRHIS